MEVTIICERFQVHFEGAASPQQRVSNTGRVFSLVHPDAFLQQRIRQSVCPHRRRALQMKIPSRSRKPFGSTAPAGPAMGGSEKSVPA